MPSGRDRTKIKVNVIYSLNTNYATFQRFSGGNDPLIVEIASFGALYTKEISKIVFNHDFNHFLCTNQLQIRVGSDKLLRGSTYYFMKMKECGCESLAATLDPPLLTVAGFNIVQYTC